MRMSDKETKTNMIKSYNLVNLRQRTIPTKLHFKFS